MAAVVGALRVMLGLDSAQFTEGLKAASRSMQNVGKNLQDIGGKFSTYVTAPVAAAGAAVSAAVVGMAKDVKELQRAATLSGLDFQRFQELAYGAKTIGIESDKLSDILKDVNDRVGDFNATGGGPMLDFFENIAPKVGITADAFRDLNSADALQLYYDSLVKAGASQQEITFYLEAMASDVTALIPLLQNGGAGFKEFGDRARETGAIIGDEAAASAERFNQSMMELSAAVTGLSVALVNSGILDWVTGAVVALTDLAQNLSSTNPEIVKWGIVVAGLAAAIGPTLVALGLMATAIGAISAPVAAVVAGIAALTAGIIIFWPEIQRLGQVMGAFVANEWRLFLEGWDAAVTKVGEVTTAIGNFIVWIGEAFAALPGQMLEIGGQIIQGLADGIMAKWEEVKQGIMDIPNNIANSFTGFFQIQSPSRLMHSVGGFIMEGLGNGMQDMAGGVTSIADNIASTIGNAFSSVIDGSKSVGEAIGDVLGQLAKLFLNQGFQALSGMGGGFGFLGNLFSGLFGFANGGSFKVGGSGGVDSQLVAFKASPNERVSITKPGQEMGGGGDIRVSASVRVENGNLVPFVTEVSGQVAGRAIKQNNKQIPNLMADHQMRNG